MMRSFWSLLNEFHVVIPIVQRDYAQGRNTARVKVIRENLLNSLCGALKAAQEPLVLDFVYGYTRDKDDKQIFFPHDGQQRLTTLYLLHWYLTAREGRLAEVTETLAKFTYEVRHSSRIFCKQLAQYCPNQFNRPVKESIINQPWFFTAWINDPTIQAMLTMLNAIQQKVAAFDLPPVWDQLSSDHSPIMFHLLSMNNLGLPDDLYIKMNARGKELTDFEYFKVRFSEILDQDQAMIFNQKIDQIWSDMFWDLYKDSPAVDIAQAVDAGIMRFFSYITDLIIVRRHMESLNGEDELARYRILYSDHEHVTFLFETLDLFCSMKQTNPDFFQSIFSTDRDAWLEGKVRLFFIDATEDLLKKCADKYDPKLRNNPFSIGEQLLLYACIL
ncbi:MAG: DUF262 domain-containing protein, partial [Erysipelotrichaceae bacterium]|nr:DUF262 domain-containing protein [Erysipelotrichaceae bacterium]